MNDFVDRRPLPPPGPLSAHKIIRSNTGPCNGLRNGGETIPSFTNAWALGIRAGISEARNWSDQVSVNVYS